VTGTFEGEMFAQVQTDAEGRFWFWSIVPSSYPIPHDGPVGEMLRAQGRHPYRPRRRKCSHRWRQASGCWRRNG